MIILIITLLAGVLQPAGAREELADSLNELTLPELKQRLGSIDGELARLARFTPRGGAGNIGWISKQRKIPSQPEWAEIQFAGNILIDQIVLVPVLWNAADQGPQADGFPEAFEVIAGAEGDCEGKVIARFGPEDQLLPRVAPLVISIPPTNASWIRIQSTQLSKSAKGNKYVFSLSEVMVFSRDRNVALTRPIHVSSTTKGWGGDAISKEALTDSFTPFLMDAGHGKKSSCYLARLSQKKQFRFSIDLEDTFPVDEIRLHNASDIRKHIPFPHQVDYGTPKRLTIEGANKADFSDAVTLLDYQRKSMYDSGPILMRNLNKTRCRYIRISVPDPYKAPNMHENRRYVNLSELEIISNGRNIAKGKRVTFPKKGIMHQSKKSITDGYNNLGTILPIRDWMEQLARRHDLEQERPRVEAALNHRYARQKAHLSLMYWLAGLLAAAIGISFLIERIIHRRQLQKMRTRFAADLHDELGADLHTIGMLSDLAQAAVRSPEKLIKLLPRIRTMTKRAGTAVRDCTNMLETKNLYNDLQEDMQRTTRRIMADFEHNLTFQGGEHLHHLQARARADLFLFYKECLINISRHSQATKYTAELTATPQKIRICVSDNGKGLNIPSQVPPSLKRRARLLKARVSTQPPPGGGTRITLTLSPNNFRFRK